MADEETQEGQAEAKGGNKTLLIIVIVLVFLLIAAGVGVFLAMGGEEEKAAKDSAELVEEEEFDEVDYQGIPGALFPLETFIVNLQVKGSFLKTDIQLEFAEPELPEGIDAQIPKVRDVIIQTLSAKTAADILTIEGKEQLREEIRGSVNEILGGEAIMRIYFTEFIVQ